MEKKIAKRLLEIKAVFLSPDEPFTWASGIKSPIYCDNRLTLSYPEIRTEIETAIAETVKAKYPEAQALAGTSTAGIPHAAIAAHILGMPMAYVRASAKDHGRNNKIEGRLEKGTKVVVIEDLISTGGSVIDEDNALREAEVQVVGIESIFTYGLAKGIERLKEANVENTSLSNYDALVEVAVESGYIKESDVKKLQAFRTNPSDSAWMEL